MTELISRADAVKTVIRKCSPICDWQDGTQHYPDCVVAEINALPSAVADGEDLIIKGAKGIQDGLYNIKDGKLFKYKAKGGTVRTYPIVPSADAVSREDGDMLLVDLNAENGYLLDGKYKVNGCKDLTDKPQGEWIMHGEPPWLVRECSECGTKWHQWSGDSNPNYCGHCGARMKGGGSE